MFLVPDKLERGRPFPLGATWDGLGINFAVFSANADAIDLCLFDSAGKREIARLMLTERDDDIWHGYLPHAAPGLVYGYRAHGPYEPRHGHRFNPSKLLLDPYAKAICGQLHWTDSLFGYRLQSPRADLSMDRRDSAPAMPKAVVTDEHFSWEHDRRPRTRWSDTVIYEAHVKGLTKLFEEVQPPMRGTFAALCHPKMIDHLKRLGVTAIELMPVQAFLQDRGLIERGLSNYWGYNTLCFFSPEPRYLSNGTAHELRQTVRRLHAAGIEVILDVVYNHTCEGNELGPTLSWRGLDNSSYYRLADNRRQYENDSGTGNALNLSHPRVLQMVMDSLRYWANSYRVDGFRFDLASTLGREPLGFDSGAGFFDALKQDPVLSSLKLIAEPWDIGPGGYQLGHFPTGFSEWNDRFRDGIRRYWRGDRGMRPDVAARLSGSGDVFDTRSRRPSSSINYVASHDGMTLKDLVTYRERHNEANAEDNHDGAPDDHSSNWGAEGPTELPEINDLRERVGRSMLVSVFSALGTPMILSGDEYGRTQKGNNNAYCQDNNISWYDWRALSSPAGQQLAGFTARLTQVRRDYLTLRCNQFLGGEKELAAGITDLSWWDERGIQLSPEDWANEGGRVLILRRAALLDDGKIEVTALMLNADNAKLKFKVPGAFSWRLLIDSADPAIGEHQLDTPYYELAGHGAVIIAASLSRPI
jgi:glycogen operon protein